MVYRIAILLATILTFVGCAVTDISDESSQLALKSGTVIDDEPRKTILLLKEGADCPGKTLDETNGVLCLFEYPTHDAESQQTIVTLKSGADCPGSKLDGLNGVLCLIEYPKGWHPFVRDGLLYYKIELAGSKG